VAAVVIGGSIAGLASALALNELGHDVRILERDPNPPPDTVEEAGTAWPRPTVPQAAHSHAFATLGCDLLAQRAPEVYAGLLEAGAAEIDLTAVPPPTLRDPSPQPGDDELHMIACRRSTFELVLRQKVLARPGVDVQAGTTVRGLEVANGTGPHVTGVRLGDDRSIPATLVIDATGRRTTASRWLADAGVPVAKDEVESSEITYYTRFYRRTSGGPPPGPLNRGFGAGGLWDHYTAMLFLGDNGTFSISIGVLPEDSAMKVLRDERAFTAALRATPLLAPWIAPGVSEPISPVAAMGGLDNSLRGAAAGAQPVPVAGLFHVGDSVCTTNPAYGRGVSLALANAYALADVLKRNPDDTVAQQREMAEVTERLFRPWLVDAIRTDRGRAGLWKATLAGQQPPQPPPGVVTFGSAVAAAAVDPVVWRRVVRMMMMLSEPDELYADPEIAQRVGAVLSAGPPPQFPAPSRPELAEAVTAAAA
jgi:2-polyprenyl-6-methoxyphenol hydroxylase-like FAD-dependent oxidoreductase